MKHHEKKINALIYSACISLAVQHEVFCYDMPHARGHKRPFWLCS